MNPNYDQSKNKPTFGQIKPNIDLVIRKHVRLDTPTKHPTNMSDPAGKISPIPTNKTLALDVGCRASLSRFLLRRSCRVCVVCARRVRAYVLGMYFKFNGGC